MMMMYVVKDRYLRDFYRQDQIVVMAVPLDIVVRESLLISSFHLPIRLDMLNLAEAVLIHLGLYMNKCLELNLFSTFSYRL